ncbi:hypothetical protein CALCODRAFT_518404 [Calocera cornea HHB12733]|uniref:BTB domain-containing protein n=1 Tax=Calocera cornea HHB12733 TaxID=1353952 RepID=A0A165F1R9_9BASI|nr:hypothetical protein CALCODRAFT_518404 [Calocera cornea HHB12733]
MSDDSASFATSHNDDELLQDSPATDNSDMLLAEPRSPIFNFATSTLTLRAIDGQDIMLFHVHRVLLIDLDGGFKDIVLAADECEGDLSLWVDVPLSPTIVDILLHFAYSMPTPIIPSLFQWQDCYAAAKLFRVRNALNGLQAHFNAFINGDPLRAYAVATRFNLGKERDLAARQSLNVDLLSNLEQLKEFESMPSPRLIELLQMHMKRDAVVRDWAAQLSPTAPKCTTCSKAHWTEMYIVLLRAEVAKNIQISMEELFRMSLIVDAITQTGLERCVECNPAGEDKKINDGFNRYFSSLTKRIEELSVSQPTP